MKKNAAKTVASTIIGKDCETVFVHGKAYVIHPPTINRLAGAGYYLADLKGAGSIADMLRSLKDMGKLSSALSYLIAGDESLSSELDEGTFDEVTRALEVGFSLLSVENFIKLSVLTMNVAMLTARQRQ